MGSEERRGAVWGAGERMQGHGHVLRALSCPPLLSVRLRGIPQESAPQGTGGPAPPPCPECPRTRLSVRAGSPGGQGELETAGSAPLGRSSGTGEALRHASNRNHIQTQGNDFIPGTPAGGCGDRETPPTAEPASVLRKGRWKEEGSEGVRVRPGGRASGAAAWCGFGFPSVWACAFGGSLGPHHSGRCCREGQKLMQI